ncbi:hypothetical protein [Sphingobacterium griseoflavum]|uniref:DUF4157 domain-containing protein n=1 Tax=Sphingobacterium griseoflavum TaxID=1474952 RepID=A0ABQ3HRV8_9SPHI|nr:hypothetical protein [Sphingobacterium griseoflavum]GHE29020.1 hypothetical protein GCM10017764_09560 [Sphingobacterium griseoflavum]
MLKNNKLRFFNIANEFEDLPQNDLFRYKGGNSDEPVEGGELPGVDVSPPDGEDPWGELPDEEFPTNEEPGEGSEFPDDPPSEGGDSSSNDGNDGSGSESSNSGGQDNSQQDLVKQVLQKLQFSSNLSAEFKERLTAALTSIQNTEIGRKLLGLLLGKTGQIDVSDSDMSSVQGSQLNIGIFNEEPSGFLGHYPTLTLGHELTHLAQNAEYGSTKTDIFYELEARLIEYRLAKELNDLPNFLLNFRDDSYLQQFVDFADGVHNSITDFNNLIDGFKDGTNGGGVYIGYDETHFENFEELIIDDLLR